MNDAAATASLSSRRIAPAGKHGGRIPTLSLDERMRDEEGSLVDLSETLGDEARLRRIGSQEHAQGELSDLAMDVGHVLSRLPSRLRRLCERLKTMSVSELSRRTGASQEELHEDIEKLRAAFEEAGLAQHFFSGSVPVSVDEVSHGC